MSDKKKRKQEENLITLQNGFEGVTYTKDESGFPVKIESEESNKTHWYSIGVDLAITANGKFIENEAKSVEFNSVATGKNKDLFVKAHDMAIVDGYTDYILNKQTDAQLKYEAILSEKFTTILVKSIMASPASFDSVYDELVSEYMSSGGDEMYEEKKVAYQETMGGN